MAVGVFAFVIFFFSPAWSAFAAWSRVPEMDFQIEVRRGASVLEQVDNPGAPLSDGLHAAIQWRLFFPVIGRILHLPPFLLFSLSHVGCVLVLGFIITLLRGARFSWLDTALAALTLCAASWFFTSTGWLGYFDSWLAFALLIAAFAQSRWSLWAACVWGPWVDERFVLAAPLALLCRYVFARQKAAATGLSLDRRDEILLPLLFLAAFVFVRLGVLSAYSQDGATVGGYFEGRDFLDASVARILLGVWEGLRGGWCFALIAGLLLWQRRSRVLAILLGLLALAVIGAGLLTAQDYSRSMTMLLPLAVLGLLLSASEPGGLLHGALRIVATGALLLPAHHVMNDRVGSIYNLHRELAAFRNPSRDLIPELYELDGISAMESGQFAVAERCFTLAIKLSRNPASPARRRGILRVTQQRWADAAIDFATLTLHDPHNPDAWFMLAQAQLAHGNILSAASDFDRAYSIATEEWRMRPAIARFATKLKAAQGGSQ